MDGSHSLVVTNADVNLVNASWPELKTHVFLGEVCSFAVPIASIEEGTAYEIYVPSEDAFFTFYFTELPIIHITTDFEIVDEPNVLAHFTMIESDQTMLESHIGIQYRGGWSQTLPKKSMEVEFWTDASGNDTQDFALLGMRSDDDCNLQAMYNEPLRIRSKTNNDLWRMIGRLHYQQDEPEAINGIRMKYAELFLNNEYRGVYCVGEKIDRKQLKLKNHNGSIRGELYKGDDWGGATTFETLPPYSNNSLVWGGFEYKHPDEETDWSRLYDFVDFVIHAPDSEFYEVYDTRFEIDNLVDYFIFLNLLRATDNRGKNLYIAKYTTNDKYFYAPWDLDGTFGTVWNGANDPTTDDILLNGLYSRLLHDCRANGFIDRLKERWLELRSAVITHQSLISMFTASHDHLERNGVYEREATVWPGFIYNHGDLDYMSDWMLDRLAYLDAKFTEECMPLSVHEDATAEKWFSVFPNPTKDAITIYSDGAGEMEITVYNNLGQTLLNEVLFETNSSISLGHLKEGMYFIHLSTPGRNEVHKVVLNGQ